jgi:CheY-like chemotaxis protein
LSSRAILIVDNDASLVAFLAFFFEDRGFTVYTAHDGSEAVGLARRHKPPIIISDMMMGQVHGFELLQQVRADPELRDTPVIIMSAKSYKSDIDRARSLGATEYIIKPFKTEDLLEMVERRLAAPGGAAGAQG